MGKPARVGPKVQKQLAVCEVCVPPHTVCQHPGCGVCRIDCPTWAKLKQKRKRAAS